MGTSAAQATLLAPFQLRIGDRLIERWERPSARRILQYLLVHPDHAVTRDELIDAIFSTLDSQSGANALAKAISMVRAAAGANFISSNRSFVRLAIPVSTDLDVCIYRLEAALERNTRSRVHELKVALAIAGDPIPEERYADWPEPVRHRLAELRRRCRFRLAEVTAGDRASPDAAAIWGQTLAADPTNEKAALAAVRAYAATGERHMAARAYETTRLALLDELGVTPSAELEAAYREAVFSTASAETESAAWLRRGSEKLNAHDSAAAETAFGRALELAHDPVSQGNAWAALASVPYQHGDMSAVIDICRTALDALPGAESASRASLVAQLGWAEVRAGRPKQALPHLQAAADVLRKMPADDPSLLPRTLDHLAIARSDSGDNAGALDVAEDAFRELRPGLPHLTAVLRMHRGKLLARAGRPEEGLGDVAAARRAFASARDDYAVSVSHWMAAEMLDQLGLLDRALSERMSEVALLEKIGNPRNLAGALIHMAGILKQLGRLSEAESAGHRALDTALESGDSRLVSWAREGFGKVSGPESLHAKQ